MRPSSFGWLRAAVFVSAVALSACSDGGSSGTATCTPACRDGFTCVSGTCVSACNPACGAGELCVIRAGAPICATLITPDGSTDDIVDATTPGDTTQPPTDVTLPDGNVPDTVTPPTDGGVRPPCGMTGQPCCRRSCSGSNVCNRTSMRCEAITPEADECTTTATCPSGQVCSFAYCNGAARSCLRCTAPAAMGAPAGTPCGTATAPVCAGGFCGSQVCRSACVPGATGDAACRVGNPRGVCGEFTSVAPSADGGLSPVSSLGGCVTTCQRDADCTGTQRCSMSFQTLADTVILSCSVPFGTLPPGGVCLMNPTSDSDPTQYCQSGRCSPQTGSTTMGNCTTYCATDTDCPSVLPHCREFSFFRPSETGTSIPIRMCDR